MKKIIVIFALSVWTNFVSAQPHVNWINYSFSQRVTDIDINGDYLWISTQGGLIKYNKHTNDKTFYNRANSNLPDNNLLGVFCAENGDVWVSSKYYGIGKLNSLNCTIYNQSYSGLPFDQLNSKVKLDGKGNVWIASFRWMVKFNGTEWKTWITGSDISPWPLVSDFDIADNGIVWLYSTDGIGKIEKDEYTIISTIGSSLTAKAGFVKVDNEGTVWIAVGNEGIYKYDGTSFTNYNTSNSCLPSNYINAISFDQENNMWLASGGIFKFKINECDSIPPKSSKGLLTIKCDENDIIWCGTFCGKLLKFDGSEFSTIELSNSPLKSNNASPSFLDSENNVWLGTTENTLKTSQDGLIETFDKKISSGILDKNGAIWLAFNTGDTCLLQINEDESMVFDSTNSPFNTSKISISHINIDNQNDLWISTNGHGIFKYDGTYFTNYTTENSLLPSNVVFQMAFDKGNGLWCGTANGLFKFDGENWTIWDTGNSSIPTNVVNELIIDSEDNMWFSCMDEARIVGGEYGGGLTKFDGNLMTTYNMSNSGLMANTIFGLLDDGDKLWIATCTAGLMSFNKADKWEVFDVNNSGIANNIVQGLVKDKNGNIWMGHNDAGISVFNPDSVIQSVGLFNEMVTNFNSKLVIYPNPVKNELFVKLDLTDEKIKKADIYDLNGRLMQIIPEESFKTKSYIYNFQIQPNLSENQIFILRLISENGDVFVGRFIISK
jgi:ligand-binding sensor domain-containing protein